MLEARGRVGGRVHSHRDPSLGAPVDLGASIVTGISPDVAKGHQPDPVAVIFRQMATPLHTLAQHLPLFHRGADPIDPGLDARVEDLQNQLMDDVAARLALLPEAEAERLSYGQLLEEALAKRGGLESAAAEAASGREADDPVEACVAAVVDAVCASSQQGEDQSSASASAPLASLASGRSFSKGPSDRQVLEWHWANLEYGCSACLSEVRGRC